MARAAGSKIFQQLRFSAAGGFGRGGRGVGGGGVLNPPGGCYCSKMKRAKDFDESCVFLFFDLCIFRFWLFVFVFVIMFVCLRVCRCLCFRVMFDSVEKGGGGGVASEVGSFSLNLISKTTASVDYGWSGKQCCSGKK